MTSWVTIDLYLYVGVERYKAESVGIPIHIGVCIGVEHNWIAILDTLLFVFLLISYSGVHARVRVGL